MTQDRVTKDDVLTIKAGEAKVFQLKTPQAVNSARVTVTYVKRMCMPADIKDYVCRTDYQSHIISITAIPK